MKSKEDILKEAELLYEKLQFKDDFLFCKILEENPDIAKELLELILGIKIRKVVVQKQKTIEITSDGRGIRLDVYLEDENSTIYDLEMQTTSQKDLPKRTRYYQGMIDLNLIQRGAKFGELKKSFIIFICMSDPFGEGRHIYTFENVCLEDRETYLKDETTKVILNAAGTLDDVSDNLKDFFELLKSGTGESGLSKRIAQEVDRARMHEEWRLEYMTLFMRDQENIDKGRVEGRLEGRAEGRLEGRADAIEKLLTKGKSSKEIHELMDYPMEEIERVEKRLLVAAE